MPLSAIRRALLFKRKKSQHRRLLTLLPAERLEDRWVLDAFRWSPQSGSNLLWSWADGSKREWQNPLQPNAGWQRVNAG
ncbi:MAG TPA: hypothetical protein VH092_27645, partial [Urbifossiella sp.]|nr:hypothetical protein [Urbifossiella sp.]